MLTPLQQRYNGTTVHTIDVKLCMWNVTVTNRNTNIKQTTNMSIFEAASSCCDPVMLAGLVML
ncbi:Hypothetical predicted protein, partial [Podarcis lilfordi]